MKLHEALKCQQGNVKFNFKNVLTLSVCGIHCSGGVALVPQCSGGGTM